MDNTPSASYIVLITGGQRSGKSTLAEKIALDYSAKPFYLATSEIKDEEMEARVKAHREHRGENWTTIEEPLEIGDIDLEGKTVVVDCITLFCTNWLLKCEGDRELAFSNVTAQLNKIFSNRNCNLIFVTNEVGMGGISGNKLVRDFTDLQGCINKMIAAKANEVFLMISGIPVKIK